MGPVPKSIRGHVDRIEYGRFLTGWALCDSDDAACMVTVFTPDGREIARGRARHERDDLRHVGTGRTDFAFRIPIQYPPNANALHVTVDGIELHRSPLPIGLGVFDGEIAVKDGVIIGAVTERAKGARAPCIRVEDQFGRTVAEGLATQPKDKSPEHAVVGSIDLRLRPDCFGFDELTLRAFADDVLFAQTTAAARLRGYLDYFGGERVRGWLLSPDAQHHQFQIEVFLDETRIGEGFCDLPREDLKEVFPIAWNTGFDFPLMPPRDRRDQPMRISFRLAGTRTELFDGPFLFGGRAPLIAAARRAAARLRADESFSLEERQAIQQAMADLITKRRHGPPSLNERIDTTREKFVSMRRVNVIIPIYKGVEITRACIESVLATRDPERDAVILVNDCSPDETMALMLENFVHQKNLYLLSNIENLGFVGSVNRGLGYCPEGHPVLLNSDTRVFPGIWDEMERLLEKYLEIGTITALSNNATIFSYPHTLLARAEPLEDISWDELAAEAMARSAGLIVDVPTGHGFCMLVRREVLDRIGHLDTRFGRGYGEENDLCQRAADLGWRNVAAGGVLVEHRESVSFGGDKAVLLGANLSQLNTLYPEYTAEVMAYERRDDLRVARWPLDIRRLRRARDAGTRYALIVHNWLGGGTEKAIADIERAYGYDGRLRMTLTFREDGMCELDVASPLVLAVFSPDEDKALFAMLDEAGVDLILIHQLLGANEKFIRQLVQWADGRPDRRMKFYMHDFYALCPRVTMLNAASRFCEAADEETCSRCTKMGGSHEANRMDLPPADHRALFAEVLRRSTEVIAPSNDTVNWAHRVFPDLAMEAMPHPEAEIVLPERMRDGDPNQIVLLGAIGPHKGSRRLLELAKEARLAHPALRFHVIGYTDIDRELRAVGNVTISGKYAPEDLESLVERKRARVALFLHEWPETFSYTLSEAWRLGLWAIVPDLGAPAERVRNHGFGKVLATMDIDHIAVLTTEGNI